MLVREIRKLGFELKKDLGKELNFSLGVCIDRHQRGQEN